MIAAAAVAAKFPPLQMLLVTEVEMHWVNLGDNVHVLHQRKAIIRRLLVDRNLTEDTKSTFECMFREEPFTNDRPQHILAYSIIQPNADELRVSQLFYLCTASRISTSSSEMVLAPAPRQTCCLTFCFGSIR